MMKMAEDIESKLLLGDTLTMKMVDQFLGVSYIQKRVIPGGNYNVVIDLSEDRFYILTRTGAYRYDRPVFKVSKVYIWSRVIEVLLRDGFV